MRVGRWCSGLAVTLLLLLGAARPSHAQDAPRLVILVSQSAGAPQVRGEIERTVSTPLAAEASVVDPAEFIRAGKAAGLGSRAQLGEEAAIPAGRAVRASFVLYICSQPVAGQSGRRRANSQAVVTLIDTRSGENALYRQLPLNRGHLGAEATTKLVADIGDLLKARGQMPADVPVAQASPMVVAGGQPAGTKKSGDKASHRPGSETKQTREAAVSTPTVDSELPPEPAEPPMVVVAPEQAEQMPYGSDWTERRLGLGIGTQLGVMAYARTADISQFNTPVIHYGGAPKASAPVFSRFAMRAELLFARWFRANKPAKFYDNIGLGLDLSVGAPATAIDASSTKSSLAYNLGVEAMYRQHLWRGSRASHVSLRLGYRRYGFGLPAGLSFPGLSYNALAVGLGFDVPLGTQVVALVGQVRALPLLNMVGEGAQSLGAQRGSGLGGTLEAGVRVSPARHIDITAQVVWSQYKADFVGTTTVSKSASQYSNVSLSDREIGGKLAVGVVF